MTAHNSKGRILYVGNCYYSNWYLSRKLRELGWKADTLNNSSNPSDELYFHGEDFKFSYSSWKDRLDHILFFLKAMFRYDIFHFYGVYGAEVLPRAYLPFFRYLPSGWDVKVLKLLGKKVVYTITANIDGVAKSSRLSWGSEKLCDICVFNDRPDICSDERNLAWGKLRNSLADYMVTIGGNRLDYNDDPRVHDVPEFWCLDPDYWNPDLLVPANHKLPFPVATVKIYHAVGNFELRSDKDNRNIKSTHIYLQVIQRLKAEGYNVELVFIQGLPNRQVRYYQVQADIVVDMLSVGSFGANVREAMMLGRPVVCYLRPEWLENMRRDVPEYVEELPVVIANPSTVYEILKDLIEHPEKREEIGRRSREFAVKWHSADAGARRMDQVYSELMTKHRR